mmetsp:Transcript_32947/g.84182  ORF Transcript_32947/g.84182 Transcript_32947/m.84182 type:complete len:303 (-) Transcript_32947:938-1846(-)
MGGGGRVGRHGGRLWVHHAAISQSYPSAQQIQENCGHRAGGAGGGCGRRCSEALRVRHRLEPAQISERGRRVGPQAAPPPVPHAVLARGGRAAAGHEPRAALPYHQPLRAHQALQHRGATPRARLHWPVHARRLHLRRRFPGEPDLPLRRGQQLQAAQGHRRAQPALDGHRHLPVARPAAAHLRLHHAQRACGQCGQPLRRALLDRQHHRRPRGDAPRQQRLGQRLWHLVRQVVVGRPGAGGGHQRPLHDHLRRAGGEGQPARPRAQQRRQRCCFPGRILQPHPHRQRRRALQAVGQALHSL